jgi:hypothetical protein
MNIRNIVAFGAILSAAALVAPVAQAQTAPIGVANYTFSVSNVAGFADTTAGTLIIEQIGADTKWTLSADWANSLNAGRPFVFGLEYSLAPGTTLHDSVLPLTDVVGQIGVNSFGSRGVFFNRANNTNRFTDGESASWVFHNTTVAGFVIRDLHVNAIFNGNSIKFGPATNPISPVPEPETYGMLLAGIGALAWMRRRKAAALAA